MNVECPGCGHIERIEWKINGKNLKGGLITQICPGCSKMNFIVFQPVNEILRVEQEGKMDYVG